MTAFGAGANAAGTTAAGIDPAGSTSAKADPIRSTAERIDLAARGTQVGSDGRVVEAHYVDQMMAIGWGVERGSIPATPEVGRVLAPARRMPAEGKQAEKFLNFVDAAMRAATPVADLVASGDVEIISIAVNVPLDGRVEVIGTYRNLRTGAVGAVTTSP